MAIERLTPLPHLIKSIRARHWSLSGALMEWVDNSLQHGLAKHIKLVIDNEHGIAIIDDGIGIDDINRVFRLGDASAYADLGNVGQYGVGCTDAMIYLGNLACVETVRDGRKHGKLVKWSEVEESGLWPERYIGNGHPIKGDDKRKIGTHIIVKELFTFYQLTTTERVGKELGLTFAPALRSGAEITLHHRLANGTRQKIDVKPFSPVDLTDETALRGSINLPSGELRWTGRAGLSASLLERFNGVHIAFRHRVIEMTRDPFMGLSAPTLYVEVQLDERTSWKYQLSDHKDRVIRYRDQLMLSINAAIKELLDKSKQQATDLALLEMTAQIQTPINKALKGAGALYHDPDEEALSGSIHDGEEKGVVNPDPDDKQTARTPRPDGEPAKPLERPTGIAIQYVKKASLGGRAFAWDINGKLMTIKLEEEMFTDVLGWPPKLRDKHVVHLVISFLSHAIEMTYWEDTPQLRRAVSKKLFEQIENWSHEREKIAPFFYKEVISGVALKS